MLRYFQISESALKRILELSGEIRDSTSTSARVSAFIALEAFIGGLAPIPEADPRPLPEEKL